MGCADPTARSVHFYPGRADFVPVPGQEHLPGLSRERERNHPGVLRLLQEKYVETHAPVQGNFQSYKISTRFDISTFSSGYTGGGIYGEVVTVVTKTFKFLDFTGLSGFDILA